MKLRFRVGARNGAGAATADAGPDVADRPFTLEAMNLPADRRAELRRLPQLIWSGLLLVWRAGRRQLIVTLCLQVATAAAAGVQLLVARRLFDDLLAVSNGKPASSLYAPFALVLAVTLVFSGLGVLIGHEQRLLTELVGRHAFDEIIRVSTAVDLRAFETPLFYDQLQRARTSALSQGSALVGGVGSLLTALLTSAGIAIVLGALQPLLLLLVVLAAVPGFIAALRNSREAYAFDYAMTPESRERMYLMELLTDRRTAQELRVFGAADYLRTQYGALTRERLIRFRSFLRRRLKVSLTGTAAGSIGTAAALALLILLIDHGTIGVATALTAALAMQQLAARFTAMTTSVGAVIEAGMFIDDYHRFLAISEEPVVGKPGRGPRRSPERPLETLRVEGVHFAYPSTGREVLKGVDLEVGPGEIVALVGENGSGKTTLVKLICQLYGPDSGRILWNGTDAVELDPDEVRDNVTVLFQDFIQYHLSAQENIALGRADRAASPDAIESAARQASAHELIAALPDGYATRLGLQFYGGHELSVGQWQRLALARAFYRGGRFLILDEPTASLDPRAEYELFQQMRKLAEGRSVLLISHRFSSVRSADRIHVMHGGRIVETGTHEGLLREEGRYAELYGLQAAAHLRSVES